MEMFHLEPKLCGQRAVRRPYTLSISKTGRQLQTLQEQGWHCSSRPQTSPGAENPTSFLVSFQCDNHKKCAWTPESVFRACVERCTFLRKMCTFPAEREPEGDALLSGFSPLTANLIFFVVYLAHLYFCAFGEAIFLLKWAPSVELKISFLFPRLRCACREMVCWAAPSRHAVLCCWLQV